MGQLSGKRQQIARSDHLYLAPFDGRDEKLAATLAWHWSNAMNQAALSLPAIASLAALYGQPPQAAQTVFAAAGISEELIGEPAGCWRRNDCRSCRCRSD